MWTSVSIAAAAIYCPAGNPPCGIHIYCSSRHFALCLIIIIITLYRRVSLCRRQVHELIEDGKESCCGGAIIEQAMLLNKLYNLYRYAPAILDVADDYQKSAESLPIKLFTTEENDDEGRARAHTHTHTYGTHRQHIAPAAFAQWQAWLRDTQLVFYSRPRCCDACLWRVMIDGCVTFPPY